MSTDQPLDTDPAAKPDSKEIVIHPDGFRMSLPVRIRGFRRGSDGSVYAIYPDGSLRRCHHRLNRNPESLRKWTARKRRRETNAMIRHDYYIDQPAARKQAATMAEVPPPTKD